MTCLPKLWTLPFIVISSDLYMQYKNSKTNEHDHIISKWIPNIFESIDANNISPRDRVIIRSSACDENLDAKGEYYSQSGHCSNLAKLIKLCLDKILNDKDLNDQKIPLIIQKHSTVTSAKGHLSNEIRFSKEKRDWLIEFESPHNLFGTRKKINFRNWRKNVSSEFNLNSAIRCTNLSSIVECLKSPSAWAYQAKLRVHFEWVWDGYCIYLVQADEYLDQPGIIPPPKLTTYNHKRLMNFKPRCLQILDPSQATQYSKIHNIYLYNQLGLPTTNFYILKDRSIIDSLLDNNISDDLHHDLTFLTSGSLVVRMDVTTDEKRIRQLLPRTNEVRDIATTLDWFSKNAKEIKKLLEYDLALIFHLFIPAFSSAFAYASPGARKVKVEALWGLPEGLYFFAHDKYIVDTGNSVIKMISEKKYPHFQIEHIENFKKRFVAPNEHGEWVTQILASSKGWGSTITKKDYSLLAYLAHMTRRIAEKEKKAVSVMWFIGVDNNLSSNGLLPWYHESADDNPRRTHKPYRQKTMFDKELVIQTTADIERLKNETSVPSCVRFFRIQPLEDKLFRSKEVLKEIGEIAKAINAVIYLEGGTLSHAYYQLERTGAQVQIASSFDGKDDKREYNKLVRDKIPSKIEEGGESVKKAQFSGVFLERLLKEKLVEEAFEVLDAESRDEILEELADISAVVDGLLSSINSDRNELKERQEAKETKSGGFSKGFVLLETDNPPPKVDAPNYMLNLLDLPNSKGTTDIDFHNVIVKNHSIKKWFDRREHRPESEALFDLVIPVVNDEWEENAPDSFFTISNDYAIRAKVFGKRQGAKLKIRFSIYTLPIQLNLFG